MARTTVLACSPGRVAQGRSGVVPVVGHRIEGGQEGHQEELGVGHRGGVTSAELGYERAGQGGGELSLAGRRNDAVADADEGALEKIAAEPDPARAMAWAMVPRNMG